MRAGPIGLLFFDDPERLVQAAHDQGRITHQDRRCSAGAVAIAGAVALALGGQVVEPQAFLAQLSEWVQVIEPSVASYVRQLAEWIALPPGEAAVYIAPAGKAPGYEDGWRGISPFVIGSLLWSLYAFLSTPDDYWATVCTAIAVGGDVDTTAAMAGAVSGAYLGLEAIPAHLAGQVTDQGTWGFDELVALAHEAYQFKMEQGGGHA